MWKASAIDFLESFCTGGFTGGIEIKTIQFEMRFVSSVSMKQRPNTNLCCHHGLGFGGWIPRIRSDGTRSTYVSSFCRTTKLQATEIVILIAFVHLFWLYYILYCIFILCIQLVSIECYTVFVLMRIYLLWFVLCVFCRQSPSADTKKGDRR